MEVRKLDYKMEKFTEENLENYLASLGLDTNNYFFGMTRASLLSRAIIGNVVDFTNRYAVICFSQEGLNLFMLSRLDNKKVTEVVRIGRGEINEVKFSDSLISYSMSLKAGDSSMKFQVFKKFGKFSKVKEAISRFREIY